MVTASTTIGARRWSASTPPATTTSTTASASNERASGSLSMTGHDDHERGGDDGRQHDVDGPHPSRIHHGDDTRPGHRAHRPRRVRACDVGAATQSRLPGDDTAAPHTDHGHHDSHRIPQTAPLALTLLWYAGRRRHARLSTRALGPATRGVA